MDTAIVASIIGGSCTVAAPIVTLAVKAGLEHRGLQELSNERRAALRGMWEGQVQQPGVPQYTVTFRFDPGRKVITGELAVDHSRAGLKGGYYDNQYMYIDYRSKDPGVIRYGLAILRLSADSKLLEGKFLGYGPERERLISGNITLTKKI